VGGGEVTRNRLEDLNNHLFEALERINDEDLGADGLELEIRRSRAITGLASQVIASGNLMVNALKLKDEALDGNLKLPAMLEGGKNV
jgi:hypothetical protein